MQKWVHSYEMLSAELGRSHCGFLGCVYGCESIFYSLSTAQRPTVRATQLSAQCCTGIHPILHFAVLGQVCLSEQALVLLANTFAALDHDFMISFSMISPWRTPQDPQRELPISLNTMGSIQFCVTLFAGGFAYYVKEGPNAPGKHICCSWSVSHGFLMTETPETDSESYPILR